MQTLWHYVVSEFARSKERDLIKENFARQHMSTATVFKDSVVLPGVGDTNFYKQLKRLQTTLETKDTLLSVPKGLEARRRISFFANSLFMTIPRAPQVGLSPYNFFSNKNLVLEMQVHRFFQLLQDSIKKIIAPRIQFIFELLIDFLLPFFFW